MKLTKKKKNYHNSIFKHKKNANYLIIYLVFILFVLPILVSLYMCKCCNFVCFAMSRSSLNSLFPYNFNLLKRKMKVYSIFCYFS